VESTINQVVSRRFVKKQSMQWTLRGAIYCAANAHQGLEQRTGRSVPPVVAEIPITTARPGARTKDGVTPDFFARSLHSFKAVSRPLVAGAGTFF
jgi:hypothetical protein